jgi:general secretion pathway protein E
MSKAMPAAAALTTLRPASGRLGAVLVRMGALSEEALLPHLSEQTDISLLASDALPSGGEVSEAVTLLALTTSWWQGREAVPFMRANQLLIAAKDPLE